MDDNYIMVTQGGLEKLHQIHSLYSLVLQDGEYEVICEDSSFGTVDIQSAVKIYRKNRKIVDENAKKEISQIMLVERMKESQTKELHNWLEN
jgi:hypothetical protein